MCTERIWHVAGLNLKTRSNIGGCETLGKYLNTSET